MDAYPMRGKDPRFYGLLFGLVACLRTGLLYVPPTQSAVRLPGSLGDLNSPPALWILALAWFGAAFGCAITGFTGRRTLLFITLPAGPAFLWAAGYMGGAPFGPRGLADFWSGVLFLCFAGFIVCLGLVKPQQPRAAAQEGDD